MQQLVSFWRCDFILLPMMIHVPDGIHENDRRIVRFLIFLMHCIGAVVSITDCSILLLKYFKRLVQTKRICPCSTMPVCRIVVILTDNESHLIYCLTDFVVLMHKAELVFCRLKIDVSGLVTSQVEDMILRLTLKSMGKTDSFSNNAYFTSLQAYNYILKLQKAQGKILDKMYTPKIG